MVLVRPHRKCAWTARLFWVMTSPPEGQRSRVSVSCRQWQQKSAPGGAAVRRWKLSQRARESSDGVQQQKASCGANRCTASMWSSSGTMPATPTRLARLDPAAYTMFTVYARRVQLTAASGCCFETIGRIGAALARRSSVLCIDTLSVQWRAARRARRAAVALGFTEPRTARAAAAHMGSRVALCARDV